MSRPRTSSWQHWLHALRPADITVDRRERLRVSIGAALGMLLAAIVCHRLAGAVHWPFPWLMAPLGASAVLVFGVPASPFAQPWSVIAGNAVSALVGVACARWIVPVEAAAALAVGCAIAAMFALRCLHPPGGGSALVIVLAGIADARVALFPVMLNSALLVTVGMLFNTLTGRPYPHAQRSDGQDTLREGDRTAAEVGAGSGADLDADLDAVLARHNQVLDISRDELKSLLEDTRLRAYQRRLANVRCRDIMSRRPITVTAHTSANEAWSLFRQHRIKSLPVVDPVGGVVGIVTQADFVRHAEGTPADLPADRLRKLRAALQPGTASGNTTIAAIMTRNVRVVGEDRHLADLIPLFSSTGHHHLPVVGEHARLVGIITQSDVVAALADPAPAA